MVQDVFPHYDVTMCTQQVENISDVTFCMSTKVTVSTSNRETASVTTYTSLL